MVYSMEYNATTKNNAVNLHLLTWKHTRVQGCMKKASYRTVL